MSGTYDYWRAYHSGSAAGPYWAGGWQQTPIYEPQSPYYTYPQPTPTVRVEVRIVCECVGGVCICKAGRLDD